MENMTPFELSWYLMLNGHDTVIRIAIMFTTQRLQYQQH